MLLILGSIIGKERVMDETIKGFLEGIKVGAKPVNVRLTFDEEEQYSEVSLKREHLPERPAFTCLQS